MYMYMYMYVYVYIYIFIGEDLRFRHAKSRFWPVPLAGRHPCDLGKTMGASQVVPVPAGRVPRWKRRGRLAGLAA
jgi:hypothetical protein